MEEALLLFPALAVLQGALLLQALLAPYPVGVIALPRSVPLSRLPLVLSLLFFQPATLLVGLPLALIVPAPIALPLRLLLLTLLLLLAPCALMFLTLLLLNLALLRFSLSPLFFLLAALLELGPALFLSLLLPDTLLLGALLLLRLTLLRGSLASLFFQLASLLPYAVVPLFLALLLRDALLFRPLLLLGLSLLLFLLLPLLAFGTSLLLLLAGGLGRLRVVLPALFLTPAITSASLCHGFRAAAHYGCRPDGQQSREALNEIEFHESSYTSIDLNWEILLLAWANGIPSLQKRVENRFLEW